MVEVLLLYLFTWSSYMYFQITCHKRCEMPLNTPRCLAKSDCPKYRGLIHADGIMLIDGSWCYSRRGLGWAGLWKVTSNWNYLLVASPGRNCTAHCSQLPHCLESALKNSLCECIIGVGKLMALPNKTAMWTTVNMPVPMKYNSCILMHS